MFPAVRQTGLGFHPASQLPFANDLLARCRRGKEGDGRAARWFPRSAAMVLRSAKSITIAVFAHHQDRDHETVFKAIGVADAELKRAHEEQKDSFR